MVIELIDRLHLKVELDNNDMNLFSVTRASFLEKNTHTKIVLRSILKNAYEQTGFDIFNKKLLVEIFPTIEDGCILLFSISKITKNRKFKVTSINRYCVYMTDNINNLLDLARALPRDITLSESSLFEYKNRFFLAFSKNCKANTHFSLLLSEFQFKKSDASVSFLKEHARLVCEKNAVLRLSGCNGE